MKKKLSILALYVLCASAPLFAVEEREGFFKTVVTVSGSNTPLLTVPDGKRFVLLQLSSNYNQFDIIVDGQIVIKAIGLISTYDGRDRLSHDFPDRCVVFEPSQVLEVGAPDALQEILVVGYFYNCNCTSLPLADLDKDCKVNFSDLALLASEWLVDNTA